MGCLPGSSAHLPAYFLLVEVHSASQHLCCACCVCVCCGAWGARLPQVDGEDGLSLGRMYAAYRSWVADLPAADQAALFRDTARDFYRLP